MATSGMGRGRKGENKRKAESGSRAAGIDLAVVPRRRPLFLLHQQTLEKWKKKERANMSSDMA